MAMEAQKTHLLMCDLTKNPVSIHRAKQGIYLESFSAFYFGKRVTFLW